MPNSDTMWLIRIGAPLVLLAASITATSVPAAAEDSVMHDVTYTVYTETPFYSEIYYRDFEPANFAGVVLDDPGLRWQLSGGIVSTNETVPMYGGIGISESVRPNTGSNPSIR